MTDHNTTAISESEEMYLITIARLVEEGIAEPIPIPLLAQELAIQPVSANQMVHKLAEEALLEYLPYRGVQLTTQGRAIAFQVLRDRRLWEVFLVKHLEISPSQADALACRFEHITPQLVTGRLAKFLGHPAATPDGLPIPQANAAANSDEAAGFRLRSLASLDIGRHGEIVKLEGAPPIRAFLKAEGVLPGQKVTPLAIGASKAMLLAIGDKQLHVSAAVAEKIMIQVKEERFAK